MKKNYYRFLSLFIGVYLCLFIHVNPCLARVSQAITLNPGWNSIFLEVEPEPNDSASVFKDLPVASVWMWNPQTSTAEFIQDMNTLIPPQPQWLVWFPASKPENILTNLFIIQGGRPYLIKIEGDQPIEWTVSGRPTLPRIKWKANSLNLVGFHLPSANERSFSEFFEPSTAHKNQEIFTLDASGRWQKITEPGSMKMKRGQAFWIFCSGASDYTGPLTVRLDQGQTLDYGNMLVEQQIRIENKTGVNKTVSVGNDGDVPLLYWKYAPQENDAGWKELPAEVSVPAGGETSVRLAVKRSLIAEDIAENSTVNITDEYGTVASISVRAVGAGPEGLWVGNASINRVSQFVSQDACPEDENIPSTPSEAQIRLILHVKENGEVQILKEAIQIWDQIRKRYVLLTDSDIIAKYDRVGLSNNMDGRRVSTAMFSGGTTPMEGSFGIGNTISSTFPMPPDDPLNPFKHKYHPDHDNLNTDFEPDETVHESYDVTRTISLEFAENDPTNLALTIPGWGDTLMGGYYREKITIIGGKGNKNICVSGMFNLHKVSNIAELDEYPDTDQDGVEDNIDSEPLVPTLTQNTLSSAQYGYEWGTGINKDGLKVSFEKNGSDRYIHVQSYDIEGAQDIEVYLNGVSMGYLTGSDETYGNDILWWIPAASQIEGVNYVEFRNKKTDDKWGVHRLGIYDAGYSFGNLTTLENGDTNHPNGFELHVKGGENRLLEIIGWDTDSNTEVSLILNGNLIGNLPKGSDGAWTLSYHLYLSSVILNPGDNTLKLFSPNPSETWGVKLNAMRLGNVYLGYNMPAPYIVSINEVIFLLPTGINGITLKSKYYDVDTNKEIKILINDVFYKYITYILNNGWTPEEQIILSPNQLAVVNVDNTMNPSTNAKWGVQITGSY